MMMMQIMKPILSFWSMTMAFRTYVILRTFNIFVMIRTVVSLIGNLPFRFILFTCLNNLWICPSIRFWRFSIIRAFKNIFNCLCLWLSIRHIWRTVLIHSQEISLWNKFLTITFWNIIIVSWGSVCHFS